MATTLTTTERRVLVGYGQLWACAQQGITLEEVLTLEGIDPTQPYEHWEVPRLQVHLYRQYQPVKEEGDG